jgi:hypothetical protein
LLNQQQNIFPKNSTISLFHAALNKDDLRKYRLPQPGLNGIFYHEINSQAQKTGPEPKIIMFIAHEDEQKAMEELELLPG